jgi:predicted Holliday junction resolvase-like endonuclease
MDNLILILLFAISLLTTVILVYKYLSVRSQVSELARREFEQWRERELATVKHENLETARREARVEFEQWKSQYEQSIRQDAVQRSQAVTLGKITEHFIPYLPDFSYNPKDARFIGSPVDFVVFDGLNEGDVRKVIFVEVKTGTSGLGTRGRRVRDAICSGRVEWREIHLPLKAGELPAESSEAKQASQN